MTTLAITYRDRHGTVTSRKVTNARLIEENGARTIRGQCSLRDELRTFTLGGILTCVAVTEHGAMQVDAETYLMDVQGQAYRPNLPPQKTSPGTAESGRRSRRVAPEGLHLDLMDARPKPPEADAARRALRTDGTGETEERRQQGDRDQALVVGESEKRYHFRDLDLLERELAKSEDFPGIGKARARKLRERFGDRLHAVLSDGDSELFDVLPGDLIGPLLDGYQLLLARMDLIQWLMDLRIDPAIATEVIKAWGDEGARAVQENIYLLIRHLGWRGCEHLRERLDIPASDDRRLVGAVEAVLIAHIRNAHTWIPEQLFVDEVAELLGEADWAERAVEIAIPARGAVYVDDGFQGPGAHDMEIHVAEAIAKRLQPRQKDFIASTSITPSALANSLKSAERQQGYPLTERQAEAVRIAANAPAVVLGGYAGSGKTTALSALVKVLEDAGRRVVMAALSGRAAQRMREQTGKSALTIAALVRRLRDGKIQFGPEDTLILDEASMIDLGTLSVLFDRMPTGRLVFIGDPAQLPPIGFGRPYHDLVEHARIPRVVLDQVMRQSAETGIPKFAEDVRFGRLPRLEQFAGLKTGVSFVPCNADQAVDTIISIGRQLAASGVDRNDMQIISPISGGKAGVDAINAHFHWLRSHDKNGNPRDIRLFPGRDGLAEGEPIIFKVNDYDREIFNGSMGRFIETDGERAHCVLDGRSVTLSANDALNVAPAYAITVHKSQGSEWPIVIMPVFPNPLNDRTLIYTGITRAKTQVILLGDRSALERAIIETSTVHQRRTRLPARLDDALNA
ncbi:AAA family ATPase [Roseibium sp. FZY0029]|uniref:ATP-dependent DNA helicase n=1 Tax=Roseibium sp. FZY0029 TaxID=3116647 RepID=UPI002EAFA600|nr:AAA family ATPase [Roseibium sp. FZY0029]